MKTPFLILVLGLFFMPFIQAQEEEIEEKKLKMGVHFTPGLINLFFENPDLGIVDQTISFKLGVDVFYKLSKRIELKTGLSGQLQHLKQRDYSVILPCDIQSSGGVRTRNSWYEDQYITPYLGIPIEARFNLTTGKKILFYKLGVEGLVRLRKKGSRKLIECRDNTIFRVPANEIQPLIANVNWGLGYEFSLAEQRLMYFEVQGSYSINKIFKKGQADINNSRLLNLGVTVGVRQ